MNKYQIYAAIKKAEKLRGQVQEFFADYGNSDLNIKTDSLDEQIGDLRENLKNQLLNEFTESMKTFTQEHLEELALTGKATSCDEYKSDIANEVR